MKATTPGALIAAFLFRVSAMFKKDESGLIHRTEQSGSAVVDKAL